MFVAEVMSMVMAEFCQLSCLKAAGRHGRTYVVGDKLIASSSFQKSDSLIDIMSDVHVEDGRRVDEADGHHVKVGVDVLPKSRGQKMLFWIVTLISLSS